MNRLLVIFGVLAWAVYASFPARGGELHTGGFVSFGYMESSRYNYMAYTEGGTSDFAEAAVNASWTIRNRTTLNGQLLAFELGPYGNYDPLIDYLFLDYNFDRSFGIRIGRVKKELGIYTHIQDVDLSRTTILLPMGGYDQRYRDISASVDGLALYGNIDLWDNAYLDYHFNYGYCDMKPDGGVAGLTATLLQFIAEDIRVDSMDTEYTVGGQLWINPGLDGLRFGWGFSNIMEIEGEGMGTVPSDFVYPAYAGFPIHFKVIDYNLKFTYLSAEYSIRDWTFISELIYTDSDLWLGSDIYGNQLGESHFAQIGESWYVSVSKRFGKWEIATVYSRDYEDKDNKAEKTPENPLGGYARDFQVAIRYDVNDHWTLKAEGHNFDGNTRLFNEFGQNPVLDEKNWTLFAFKTTFSF